MGQPKERKIRTLSSKITVMILLMIVVSTAAVGAFSYFFYRNSVIDNYSRQALQLATAFAELIDADEFQNTMATLETGEYDAELQAHVDRIKADLGMAFLYAGTFDENVGLYSYIEALLPNEAHNYGLGDVVPIEAFPPAAINANRGAPGSTDIIYDPVQGVRLIAAYAPIYDSSRNIVGIAGACFNVTEPLANVNEFALIMLAIIVLAVCVLIWFPVIFIRKSVAHPLTLLRRIAVGDTSVNINTNSNDEVGLLAGDFIRIQSMFGRLINDLKNLAEKHERYGETDARLNASDYSGAYADVAVSINKMLDNKDAIDNETFKCIMNIVDGHFDTPLRKFPGKVAFINETVDGLRENMRGVKEDIAAIVESVAEGNLAYTADISRYKGDWAELMKGLNNILTGIHEALDENVKVIHVMAGGDFTKKAEGNFKGDFLAVSNALNTTVDTISSYIEEITSELSYIANGDLRHGIKREYIGQFVSIKDSINTIVIEISKMMGNISNASGEVLSGAVQISENSANLSQGVSEQLGSLQELTASVSGIEAQSKENAGNAQNAAKLAQTSSENVGSGNNEMRQLLLAMSGITESSNKISHIIKTIDDISFQTNILALNAAVEAARAGQHGKGFAVVAEEVRNLANRSSMAAKETSDLIQESLDRVKEGTERAEETANILERVVGNVSDVSALIEQIHSASKRQSDAIDGIGTVLGQINNVVRNESATTAKSADAADALTQQAHKLQEMIGFFKTARA